MRRQGPRPAATWRMRIPTSVRLIHTTDDSYLIEGCGVAPVAEPIQPPARRPVSVTATPEGED